MYPGTTAESAVGNTVALMLALLMIAYPFYRVVGMLVEGTIEGVEATVYFAVLLGFLAGIVMTWGTALGFLLFLMLGALCFGYRFIQATAERHAMDTMDAEDLAECDDAIERAPALKWPYDRAVAICRRREDYERAIEYVERYMTEAGDSAEMQRVLERLKTLLRQRAMGAKVCPECGTENYAGATECASCGRSLALPSDLLAGCATDTGLKALSATGITLMVAGIVLVIVGADGLLVGVLFVGAFSASVAYLYLRS